MATWRQKGFDEVPALAVRGRELRRSLKYVTAGYVFCMLFISCTSGSQVIVFAKMLGFEDFHFGLMAAIPYVATLGQLFAAVVIERTGLKKFQFIQCGSISRLLWLGVAAVPLVLPIPSQWAVYAMLAVLAFSGLGAALSTTAWMTWMGDLIPKRIRGRYLSVRTMVGTLIRLPLVIALGIILDRVTSEDAAMTLDAQPELFWTCVIILAAGAILGTIDIQLFHRVREVVPVKKPHRGTLPPPPPRPRLGVRELLIEPLRDRVFRRYVLYGATITFAVAVGGSYFWLNAMENLWFSKTALNVVFLVISPISAIIGVRWWGKVMDSWGRRPVLILATLGTFVSVSHWFFLRHDTPAPQFVFSAVNGTWAWVSGLFGHSGGPLLAADAPVGAYLVACLFAVVGGVSWNGVALAQTGVVFGFADGRGRSRYVAASAVLLGLGGVLGGVCGGVVPRSLHLLREDPTGPFGWNQWHVVFAISLVMRMVSALWLIHMPDPGSRPLRHMVREAGTNVYNTVRPRLFYALRLFGWGPDRRNNESQDSDMRDPEQ